MTPDDSESSGIQLEHRTIDVIPDAERHGTPRSQFTLWFGATTQITAIVDGALAVVFGADALWAIPGLLLGNIFGGVVMALHSAQGPRLGLPQMLSSRAQFGVYGAVLPLVLVVLLYLGFAATGSVLGGQAASAVFGIGDNTAGIFVFGALTAVVAIIGYRVIHALGRIATVAGTLGLGYLMIVVVTGHDLGAVLGQRPFEASTFLLAVALGAGWQLTFGPYVADYSRYLPRSTQPRTVFWATFSGSVLGSQLSMTLGAFMAAIAGDAFLNDQVGYVGQLAGPGVLAVLIYVVVLLGKLTINCLNAYGGFMSMLTTVTAFTGRTSASPVVRAVYILAFTAVSVLVAVAASADFLENFKNFALMLLMVFVPWSAINLIDYYLISRERVDVEALYDPNGRYGRWNAAALTCYLIGIGIQIPFMSQSLYTGPITELLGGADISWIVGLVITAGAYYPWARRTSNPPPAAEYGAHATTVEEK